MGNLGIPLPKELRALLGELPGALTERTFPPYQLLAISTNSPGKESVFAEVGALGNPGIPGRPPGSSSPQTVPAAQGISTGEQQKGLDTFGSSVQATFPEKAAPKFLGTDLGVKNTGSDPTFLSAHNEFFP